MPFPGGAGELRLLRCQVGNLAQSELLFRELTHRLYLRHIEDAKLAQEQRLLTAEREAADAARHLAELQRSESRFQKAFSHAAIGMALVTDKRVVLQANPFEFAHIDEVKKTADELGAKVTVFDANLDPQAQELLAAVGPSAR